VKMPTSNLLPGPLTLYPGICRFAIVDYAATKHAVLGMVRSLHKNPYFNLRVNAIAPSWTATSILPPEFVASLGDIVQSPDVVARSVVLLMADKKRHGECIYSEKGRYWDVENGENGYHEGLKRMMPEADVEGISARIEGLMAVVVETNAKARAELKAKVRSEV
jgi:NAD(P)-dependent dehydrogenase (short-subunit alcohol dehydrogenase family)